MIGSRQRKASDREGVVRVLIIRRKRCEDCQRIHHELPDCLIPYKRYESASLEHVLTTPAKTLEVEADDSTLYRWKAWFHGLLPYLIGCLSAMIHRLGQPLAKDLSILLHAVHQPLGHLKESPGWLARIVRPVANFNLWRHTRSAFLSGNL